MKIKIVSFSDIVKKDFSLCASDYINDDSIVDVRSRENDRDNEINFDEENR